MSTTETSLEINQQGAAAPAAPAAPAKTTQPTSWPSPARAYYTVFLTSMAVAFAEIDRGSMQLLIAPIKAHFHLNDIWMGMLLGPLFATFYAACGIPTSRYIDRHNRTKILAWALGIWSSAAMLCGLAQNFVQLAAARLILGAGESPNGPAIFSILSDSFPKRLLTRGIALMQFGIVLGNGFALIMTGVLIAVLAKIPDQHIAGIGVIRWWQMVFIAVGLPGIFVAVLIHLTGKEPPRHGVVQASEYTLIQVLAYMASKWRVFGPFMGSAFIGGLGLGITAWTAAFFQRTYHWPAAKIGIVTGITSLIAVPIGLLLGTLLYERLVSKGHRDAAMRVVVVGRLIALPFSALMPLMPTGELALAMQAVALVVLGATGGSNNTILQLVSPNQMRGQITAIWFLFYTLVGMGLSPLLIGMATVLIFKDESLLRYAILSASLLFGPTSLFVLWLGMKPYAREIERLEHEGLI